MAMVGGREQYLFLYGAVNKEEEGEPLSVITILSIQISSIASQTSMVL